MIMRFLRTLCLLTISLLPIVAVDGIKPEDVRAKFEQLRNGNRDPVVLKNLRDELTKPDSPIWDCLGEMVGVTNFDKLPDGSKHLDLLAGKSFLESGALYNILLWGGQDFYTTDRITVRDYFKNLLKNPVKMEDFNPDKPDHNLDKEFLVEDSTLNEKIIKWVEDENEETGKDEWKKITKDRAKTDSLGLLTRLLLHTDSDDRIGAVSRSQPVAERLFSSKFIANLLILLENSRLNGELKDITPENLWERLASNGELEDITPETLWERLASKEGFQYKNSLLTGLQIDVDDTGLVTSVTYRDFTRDKGNNTETIKPDQKKYAHLLWTQFFKLFFEALEESGYFKKVDHTITYPYFLPSLVLQGYVILAEQTQGYVEVLNKYTKLEKTKNKKDPGADRLMQYELFEATNFFDLKSKILQKVLTRPEVMAQYLNKGYVLHYLSTKGISPQSQLSTDYKVKNKQTPSFTNCVETGLFNLFGLFLPFDQNTGEINFKAAKNPEIQNYLKGSGKDSKVKEFTKQFLVDQAWLPYINLKFNQCSGVDIFGPTESVLYIKLPESNYELVKEKLKGQEGIKISENVDKNAHPTGFDCFKIEYSGEKKDHPIGHDLVFIKEHPNVVLYEVESGLMTFSLFERMFYGQVDSLADLSKHFVDIIASNDKTKVIPQDFVNAMKSYNLNITIDSGFEDASKIWRGTCEAKAKKIDKTEPLEVKIGISSGHTDVKFSVDTGVKLPDCESFQTLSTFFSKVLYSANQKVQFDNFDCEPWLWLTTAPLMFDTIIDKKWNTQTKQYDIQTIDTLAQKNNRFKKFIYSLYSKFFNDAQFLTEDNVYAATRVLGIAQEYDDVAVIKKMLKLLQDKPQLLDLSSNQSLTYFLKNDKDTFSAEESVNIWLVSKYLHEITNANISSIAIEDIKNSRVSDRKSFAKLWLEISQIMDEQIRNQAIDCVIKTNNYSERKAFKDSLVILSQITDENLRKQAIDYVIKTSQNNKIEAAKSWAILSQITDENLRKQAIDYVIITSKNKIKAAESCRTIADNISKINNQKIRNQAMKNFEQRHYFSVDDIEKYIECYVKVDTTLSEITDKNTLDLALEDLSERYYNIFVAETWLILSQITDEKMRNQAIADYKQAKNECNARRYAEFWVVISQITDEQISKEAIIAKEDLILTKEGAGNFLKLSQITDEQIRNTAIAAVEKANSYDKQDVAERWVMLSQIVEEQIRNTAIAAVEKANSYDKKGVAKAWLTVSQIKDAQIQAEVRNQLNAYEEKNKEETNLTIEKITDKQIRNTAIAAVEKANSYDKKGVAETWLILSQITDEKMRYQVLNDFAQAKNIYEKRNLAEARLMIQKITDEQIRNTAIAAVEKANSYDKKGVAETWLMVSQIKDAQIRNQAQTDITGEPDNLSKWYLAKALLKISQNMNEEIRNKALADIKQADWRKRDYAESWFEILQIIDEIADEGIRKQALADFEKAKSYNKKGVAKNWLALSQIKDEQIRKQAIEHVTNPENKKDVESWLIILQIKDEQIRNQALADVVKAESYNKKGVAKNWLALSQIKDEQIRNQALADFEKAKSYNEKYVAEAWLMVSQIKDEQIRNQALADVVKAESSDKKYIAKVWTCVSGGGLN